MLFGFVSYLRKYVSLAFLDYYLTQKAAGVKSSLSRLELARTNTNRFLRKT